MDQSSNMEPSEIDALSRLFMINVDAGGVIRGVNHNVETLLGPDCCGNNITRYLSDSDRSQADRVLKAGQESRLSIMISISGEGSKAEAFTPLHGELSSDGAGGLVFYGFKLLGALQGENKFRTMVETTGEGILVHKNAEIKYVNQACVDMLGITIDEAMSTSDPYKHLHPDDFERINGFHMARLRGESAPEIFEFRLLTDDGSLRWVTVNARLIDWDGDIASLVVMKDITHLKELSHAHQETREMFSRVVDVIPSFLSISSLETGDFIFANPKFYDVFGYSEEEMVGSTSLELGLWKDSRHRDQMLETLKKGENFQMESMGVRKGGEAFPIRMNAILLPDSEVPHVIVVGDDISAETERQNQLIESREEAELASRTKSQFLANMSHELRTPLNAILGFSQFIRDQLLGRIEEPRYVEYANDIHTSGTHLLSIINEILDLSKVESGKLDFRETDVNVREMAVSTFNLLRGRALEYGVMLINKIPDADIILRADEMRLKQSLINLLSNAIKFTPKGETVILSSFVDDMGRVIMEVTDTGIGMGADQIAIAFEPFGQVENTYTNPERGTGLGLPLVKAFVTMHQGEMELESEVDKGTTVRLIFPTERTIR